MTSTPGDPPRPVRVSLGASVSLFRSAIREVIGREPDLEVVAETPDPEVAIAHAGRLGPDVAVLHFDCIHGIDACAAIKATGTTTRVLVIGTTDRPDELVDAVEAGADGYVSVGSGLTDVVAAVRRLAAGEAWIPPAMLGALLGDLIRRRRAENAAAERVSRLTRREREVLALLTEGMEPQTMAEKLFLSPNTVRTHVQNVLQTLEVHSRLEAVSLAIESGMFEPSSKGES